jgi:hypothetical protein
MIYKISGNGKDYKDLEIGDNDDAIGITIIDNPNDAEYYVQVPRADWEDVIRSMEYMKSIRIIEENE